MSLSANITLAAAILNALLTIFVFRAGVQVSSRLAYLIWGVSIVVWNTGTFQMFRVQTHDDALDWARFLQMGVIFLPISLVHLCFQICNLNKRVLVLCMYGIGIALAATIPAGIFVADVRNAGYAWYSVGGPTFWGFVVLESTLGVSTLVFLWRAKRGASGMRLGQIRSLLWAMGILVAGGNNDILPIVGIYHYPFLNTPIFPLGSLCAIFYGILVAYSVLQYQLLEVHVGLSRFAAHAMRLAFLGLIGLVLMLVISLIAPKDSISPFAFWTSLAVLVASGFIASRYMPKLLGAGQESLERRLLGDHFEYQDKVRVFIEQCRWHTDLDPLLKDLHVLLVNTLGVKGYWLILLDETNRAFGIARAHPDDTRTQIPNLRIDAEIFKAFADGQNSYLPLDVANIRNNVAAHARARGELKQFSGKLAFPLMNERAPLGLLIIGGKSGEGVFTQTDVRLLSELATNLSLVINQISIKNQLLHTKELDLLGRMSQGMAHDLNNLTTPVWTLLQLLTEGAPPDVLRHDLAPVAIRNLQTMREYIKEALFFSENLRPDYQFGRLDVVVAELVEQARENNRKGKSIQYILRSCGDVLVEMDKVLIRRLLSNIIANAVDASAESGSVEVELIRLVKTDPERDWFRVRITDHGGGIAAEDIERIFQAYFSTKKTGDENRGFGLGLAICRKIATLHGGNLTASSEVGKGTFFNLDLPNRQKLLKAPTHTEPAPRTQ